jgi:tetraacyldisaccharide 4'-kinase
MRAPAFWWRTEPTIPARLLKPASILYAAVAIRRLGRPGERAGRPVICVGNLTAGGAGKTPTALMLAELLRGAGASPVFLTRGYGGRLAGPVKVEPNHRADDVGDEPLLLARCAPTVVSRDRPAGARLATEIGDIIVTDDGLQNPSLKKDLAMAVVDGAVGAGNGLVLPAGPLRAPLEAQWPLVDVALIIGDGIAGDALARAAAGQGKPVFRGKLVPDADVAAQLRGRRVLAFAGIGHPEKFFGTLREIGAIVEKAVPFPDHHRFGERQLSALLEDAKRENLVLVTTEKDAARMASPAGGGAVTMLPVRLEIENESALRRLIVGAVNPGPRSGTRNP